MDIIKTKNRVSVLRENADKYFSLVQQFEQKVDVTYHMGHPSVGHYWDLLDSDAKKLSSQLQKEMLIIVGDLSENIKSSSLLNEADERDLGKSAKAMRANLRLRKFRSWDPEVLHDEGYVLGINPPGQSEDEPLPPDLARTSFFNNLDIVDQQLDILGVFPNSLPTGLLSSNPNVPSTYRPNTAFIMMQIDSNNPHLNDIYDVYKECFKLFDIVAIRADDIEHNDVITSRILDEIKTSEFLLGDLTGERPSVYYEVGYAHSLGRRVIMYKESGTSIHFDLAAYNCPEYTGLRDLREKVIKRLESMTGRRLANV